MGSIASPVVRPVIVDSHWMLWRLSDRWPQWVHPGASVTYTDGLILTEESAWIEFGEFYSRKQTQNKGRNGHLANLDIYYYYRTTSEVTLELKSITNLENKVFWNFGICLVWLYTYCTRTRDCPVFFQVFQSTNKSTRYPPSRMFSIFPYLVY